MICSNSSLAYSLSLGLLLASCVAPKKANQGTASAPEAIQSPTSAMVSSLSIGAQIIADVSVALSESGMTKDQIAPLQTGAFSAIGESTPTAVNESVKTSLALAADAGKVSIAAPAIVQAMITGIKKPEAQLSTAQSKIGAASTIAGATFKALKYRMAGLTTEEREALPVAITTSAIKPLSAAGLSGEDLNKGMGQVISSSVGGLSAAGFSTTQVPGILSNVASESVKSFKEAGFSNTDVGSAMQTLMREAVSAMPKAGLDDAAIGKMVTPFMTQAVGALKDFGLKGTTQIQAVMPGVMAGMVGGLGNAGFQSSEKMGSAMKQAVNGAMAGATSAGVKSSDIQFILGPVMQGAVGAFSTAGVKTAEMGGVAAQMTNDAIGLFDAYGIKDQTVITNATKALAKGTVAAFGSYRDSGVMKSADVEKGVSKVTQSAVGALFNVSNNGGGSDLTTMTRGFSEGVVSGLVNIGWRASDITPMTTQIAAGVESGLKDKGVSQAAITTMSAGAVASANGYVSEMKVYCSQGNGVWDDVAQFCRFPVASAAKATTKPTADEEQKCQNIGGFVLYDAAGKWFCDKSAGLTVSGEADCVAAGFSWVARPTGSYCETVRSFAAGCPAKVSELSCTGASGCMWGNGYCQDKSMLSCSSLTTQPICTTAPGCVWDMSGQFCKNSTTMSCAATTESACQAMTGCSWGSNRCANVAAIDCSLNKTDAVCGTAMGCGWNQGSCVNLSFMSCPAKVTQISCSTMAGCAWTGTSCINSANQSCEGNVAQNTCQQMSGCQWNGTSCRNSAFINCSVQSNTDVCAATNGCVWSDNSCRNSAAISCGGLAAASSCNATSGCLWNSAISSCQNAAALTCFDKTSPANCGSQAGCVFNTTSNVCENASMVDCGGAISATSCSGRAGCFWEATKTSCLRSATVSCGTSTDSTSCGTKMGCSWMATPSPGYCVNTAMNGGGCGANTVATCGSFAGCGLDANNTCVAVSVPTIGGDGLVCSFATSATCNADPGCLWNGAQCKPKPPNAPGCLFWEEITACTGASCQFIPPFGTAPAACTLPALCATAAGGSECTTAPRAASCTWDSPSMSCLANSLTPPGSVTWKAGITSPTNFNSLDFSWSSGGGADLYGYEAKLCPTADCNSSCIGGGLIKGLSTVISVGADGPYFACVRSKNKYFDSSTWSKTMDIQIDRTPPAQPSVVSISGSTPTSLTVYVMSSEPIVFKICSTSNFDGTCYAPVGGPGSTSIQFSGLVPSTPYFACAKARDSAGNFSAPRCTTTSTSTTASSCIGIYADASSCDAAAVCAWSSTAPAQCLDVSVTAPTGVSPATAIFIQTSSSAVSWNVGSGPGYTGQDLRACPNGVPCTDGTCTATQSVGPAINSSTITGLTHGIAYRSCIRSTGKGGAVSAWAMSSGLLKVALNNPTAPSGISFSTANINANPLSVSSSPGSSSWNPVNMEYRYCTDNGCSMNCSSPVMSTDVSFGAEGAYYICARSVDAAGNFSTFSASSGTVFFDTTPPSPPTGFNLTPVNGTQLDLSFTASTDALSGMSSYEVKVCYDNEACASCAGFGNATPTGTSVSFNSLSPGFSYKACVRAKDMAGNFTGWQSSANVNLVADPCDGLTNGTWVRVPGDSNYSATPFCVMKYAASITSSRAYSLSGATPSVLLTRTAAASACTILGVGYHLLTNNEWMTIASNAARWDKNWTDNTFGSGWLRTGYSSGSTVCAAPANDALAYTTSGCSHSSAGQAEIRRTKVLSNGTVVWDIGGNVSQWVSDNIPTSAGGDAYVPFNTYSMTPPKRQLIILNSEYVTWPDGYGAQPYGVGQVYMQSTASTYALIRGGSYISGSNAGLFFAKFLADSDSGSDIGFRCAYTIP